MLDSPELRELSEEKGFRLTDSRHMMDMIPFILHERRTRVREEIQGKDIYIIFDGTARLGEALVLIVRFLDEWTVKQRLVGVQFLQKSVNGEGNYQCSVSFPRRLSFSMSFMIMFFQG